MKKRILFIAHAFLPDQNPRSFISFALAKSLQEKGFSLDIILPKQKNIKRQQMDNIFYYEIDQFPFQSFFNHFYFHKSLLRIIIAFLNRIIWPDLYFFWFLGSKKTIKNLLLKNSYACIISSSVPFSSHLIGGYAKRLAPKLRWIAEYGDPFSFNYCSSPAGNIFSFLNKPIEAVVVKNMDFIVVPNNNAKNGFLENFHFLEKSKIKVIHQFFEPAEPSKDNSYLEFFDGNVVNIVYTGLLYPDVRNPEIFLKSLEQFNEMNTFGKKIRAHFFGYHGLKIKNIFKKFKSLKDDKTIIIYGPVDRSICALACKNADFLLNISNVLKYQTPSKLVDYLFYKKPIISLNNELSGGMDWPFLINVDYEKDKVLDLLERLSLGKVRFNFEGREDILIDYGAVKNTQKYIDLIL